MLKQKRMITTRRKNSNSGVTHPEKTCCTECRKLKEQAYEARKTNQPVATWKVFAMVRLLTLSSAAAFKLYFCGILLRSKTTKMQLKSCPVERSGTMLQRLVRPASLPLTAHVQLKDLQVSSHASYKSCPPQHFLVNTEDRQTNSRQR